MNVVVLNQHDELRRTIAWHLASLLHIQVEAPVYRENRWDQRILVKAVSYQLTVDDHSVPITSFEVKEALLRHTLPAYAIHLDGARVPFELASYRDVDWQLARTVWIAVSDLRISAEQQTREAAEHAALGVES